MCETCGCLADESADVQTRAAPARVAATRAAPDRDLVLKRNNVERLKAEKFPLDIIHEIPELAERNYLDISEEDMVRFQWYGLYHDKPKVGYFMLRIKVPSGILTPAQYRTIGELAQRFGRDYTELSTRQNIQLHWIQIKQLPEVFAALERVGLTSVGGCGDTVRNITGCPMAGLDAEELFDCRPVLGEVVTFFQSHRDYFDLPRKHKITISTCAYHCNAPEINCIVFIGTRQPDAQGRERPGFSLRVGGGLSSTPRIARDLGVFVEPQDVLPTARAILDIWREDPKYRLSRAKARLNEVIARVAQIGFPLEVNRLRGASVACTGQPLCNFAVATTKPKLEEIVLRLEERFGRQVEGLKLGVDGCPHACAHHWVTDIGLQGTTARGDGAKGKLEAYEIYLRGGLGANAAVGRPILRRVPAEEAPEYVERLVAAYLDERGEGEPFQAFAQRKSDDELQAIARGERVAVSVG